MEVLDRYKILDTPSEADFDHLVRLAAWVCGTPMSLVSFVDRDRQWFKGRYGIALAETPRRLSFCAYAILEPDEPMEVPDAAQDPRFADNDLVTGELHLRYYLGVPLLTPDGYALGTLCVLDTRPRHLSPEQKDALRILARQVMTQLELRRRVIQLNSDCKKSFQDSETRLRLAVDSAELGMYERDLATNTVTLNETCKRLLGLEDKPAPPDLAHGSVEPEEKERVLKAVARAFEPATREIRAAEFRILRPDGTTHWVAGRGRVIFDDSVRPARACRFIGVLNDITERKSYEESLLEQAHLAHLRADLIQALQQTAPRQALLQRATALLAERLDAAFARLWTLDATGQILELQASAGLYTHLDGAHGRVPVGQLKIGRIAQERRPLFTNQVIGDPNIPAQVWARREGLVAFAGFPLLLEGRLLGVVALFARHPLSSAALETFGIVAGILAQSLGRLAAEQALHAAKEELARANAELEQRVQDRTAKLQETVAELEYFSYTLTHDMRAPLRAMRGIGQMLLAECAECLQPEGRDLIRRIGDAALRMDRLITDALDYSRIVREELELHPVDPLPLLRGIVETYPQFQHPRAEIQLASNIPLVLANEAALTQCFSNLLENAVKFVERGVRPRIRVWAEPATLDSEPSTRIWVEDNGIGIPPEYHEKIWQMFHRLSKSYEGTGIGLALVRKVVERMNGRVGLDSGPGPGSRFWVELRCA